MLPNHIQCSEQFIDMKTFKKFLNHKMQPLKSSSILMNMESFQHFSTRWFRFHRAFHVILTYKLMSFKLIIFVSSEWRQALHYRNCMSHYKFSVNHAQNIYSIIMIIMTWKNMNSWCRSCKRWQQFPELLPRA